jgi:hypothetical protein
MIDMYRHFDPKAVHLGDTKKELETMEMSSAKEHRETSFLYIHVQSS